MEVDHGHAEARLLEDLVVAPHLHAAQVGEERLARSRRPGEPRVGIAPALRVSLGGAHHRRQPRAGDLVHDVRARLGGAGEMERAVGRGEQPADHVHMDARHGRSGRFGMAHEPGLRSGDLGKPKEAERPARRGQRPARHRRLQRAGDLEDRRAAGSIVVGPRGLMAEVSGEDDFLCRPLLARDRRGDDVVGRGHHARAHPRVQRDLLSRPEAGPKVLRLPRREHEGERVPRLVGRQVPPAHEVAVVSGPRGALVRVVRQEPGGSPLLESMAQRRRLLVRAGDHDPQPAERTRAGRGPE